MKLKAIPKILKVFGIRGFIGLSMFKLTEKKRSKSIKRIFIKKFDQYIFIRHNTSDFDLLRDFFWGDINSDKKLLYDVEFPKKMGNHYGIIDAGANIGLFSILIANKYPDTTVLAVEPEKANFEMLKLNVECLKNVKAINSAIWSKSVGLQVTTTEISSGTVGYIVKEIESEKADIIGVPIDKLILDNKFSKIGILKMDIEGSEFELFNSGNYLNWINNTDMLLIEVHDCYYPGLTETIKNIMQNNNFSVEVNSEDCIFRKKSI